MSILLRGKKSLSQLARAILRSFGSNAHSYPFSTRQGAYQTSAGPVAAAVNDPIGLELDAMGTVGANVITGNSATFDSGVGSWTSTTASIAAVGGELQITQTLINGRAALSFACNVGSTYEVSADVRSINGIWCSLGVSTWNDGNGAQFAPPTTSSTYTRQTLRLPSLNTPNTSYTITVGNNGDSTGVFACDNISVKEVTGNHATKPTAINRPTLQQDGGGRWYASFNGTNQSMALSSVPFQMVDDLAVVACVQSTNASADRAILSCRSNVSTNPVLVLDFSAGAPRVVARDDAGTIVLLAGTAEPGICVVSFLKRGNTFWIRQNGVVKQTVTTALGATTLTGAAIGVSPESSPNSYFQGAIYDLDTIKGTVTDAQLLTLEKAAAQKAGLVL